MGYLRFLLAVFVAASHFAWRYMPINFGVLAVECFYFLSGYLMSLSYARFQRRSAHPWRDFYVDRVFRLYPAFVLVYLTGTIWWWHQTGENRFFTGPWFAELLIIPQNYYEFVVESPAVSAPTWSLGAEVQFYLLVPLIFGWTKRSKLALLVLLVAGQVWVMQQTATVGALVPACSRISRLMCSWHVSDLLAYRWLPFCAVPFLLGHIAFAAIEDETMERAWKGVIGLYGFLLFMRLCLNAFRDLFGVEILMAGALLIPLSRTLFTEVRQDDRLDALFGKLAYPFFLVHRLAFAVAGSFVLTERWRFTWGTALALALSGIVMALQARVDGARYRFRGFGKVTGDVRR